MMAPSPKRTVAIIAPYFPPNGGGSERYAYEMAYGLQKDYNWRVIFITSGERFGKDIKEEVDGITVYRMRYFVKFSNTPFSFGWFRKIRKILKTENPDIVNIHMPVPGIGDIAARFVDGKPLVVTYHASTMQKGRLPEDALIWLYENIALPLLLSQADRVISSSNSVRLNFLRHHLAKSETITPGVNFEHFRPNGKRAQDPNILFVANLNRSEQHKGLKTLLEAMQIVKKMVPEVKLVVIGEGDMRPDYEAYAKKLGLDKKVEFMGRLTGTNLVSAFQEGYVLAMPSRNESFGMVILEAMACELPVVASMIGDVPSIIDDGKTGFIIPPGDREALAEKLTELLSDPKQARIFGEAGRDKILKKFGWDQGAENYDKMLDQVIKSKRSNRHGA